MNKEISLNWQQVQMLKEVLLETLQEDLSNTSKFIIQDIISKLNEE